MMPREISTLPNGNVLVVTRLADVAQVDRREYFRRGQQVYRLQVAGAPLLMGAELRFQNKALRIRRSETLEDTIRRALDERDGIRKPTPLLDLCDMLPAMVGLFMVAGGCAVVAAIAALALVFFAFQAFDRGAWSPVPAAVLSCGALAGAGWVLYSMWSQFEPWRRWIGTSAGAWLCVCLLVVYSQLSRPFAIAW